MQPAIGSALRTALKPIARPAGRVVGGARYPLSRRAFHRSTNLYQSPGHQEGKGSEGDNITPEAPKSPREENIEEDITGTSSSVVETDTTIAARTGRQTRPRSRANRQRQPEGLPPVALPDWFLLKNVKRFDDPPRSGSLAVYGTTIHEGEADQLMINLDLKTEDLESSLYWAPIVKDPKYTINLGLYIELLSTLNAAMLLRPPRTEKTVQRPVTILHCPKDGGIYFLDSVMEEVARRLKADLISLDAQDIAQIVGPYVDENLAWTDSDASFLAYSAYKAAGKVQEYGREENEANEGGGEDSAKPWKKVGEMDVHMKDFARHILESPPSGPMWNNPKTRVSSLPVVSIFGVGSDAAAPQTPSKLGGDHWYSLKVSAALDALIGAVESKRALTKGTESPDPDSVRTLIIQVKDYNNLSDTQAGPGLLRALRSVVDKRWQEGKYIILVGTSASDDLGLSKNDIQHVQLEEDADTNTRTIVVPPQRGEDQEVTFSTDEKARIRRINVRHIEDMILKLHDGTDPAHLTVDMENGLDDAAAYAAGLEEEVWSYARVRRLATVALGYQRATLRKDPGHIDGDTITMTLKILAGSDEAKFKWGAAELKKEEDEANAMMQDRDKPTGDRERDKFNKVRKKCTNHEKRLLSGVKIPSEIKTSFNDVHAPEETVEALKTLTSLSLQRPEAFSYGVLATDKIPGLLLYGPPGTGKTMLAKAVARDSGAIVLEVSGATINDMYVGEGEKNVKAIFTLAKKLSPCVVFIDEADALLAARGGSGRRSVTHREIINQFLREWDGMNDHAAFIMVATNRPYDLDEAVLRRLPRRLLVDLPVEKDRASILSLHLKNETLDPSISIPDLAAKTPYYSGSDLKNVCVAAALACLRDENAVAAAHAGPDPYVYPKRRLLTKQHFDKALDEISASISDDMSTLKAIRKFDEKYGDRKGRRKKTPALGFGGTAVEEKDSEAGRVRKIEA
jgi:SpoVK/Ycf46/Vps4 family AAA+-type ATPase